MGKPSDMFEKVSQLVKTPQKLQPTCEERNDIATENSFQLEELPAKSTLITNVSIRENNDSSRKNLAPNSSATKPRSVTTTSLVDHGCDCSLPRIIIPVRYKSVAKCGFQNGPFKMIKRALGKEFWIKVGPAGFKKQVKWEKVDLKAKLIIFNDQLLAELNQKEQEDKAKEEWELENVKSKRGKKRN